MKSEKTKFIVLVMLSLMNPFLLGAIRHLLNLTEVQSYDGVLLSCYVIASIGIFYQLTFGVKKSIRLGYVKLNPNFQKTTGIKKIFLKVGISLCLSLLILYSALIPSFSFDKIAVFDILLILFSANYIILVAWFVALKTLKQFRDNKNKPMNFSLLSSDDD